MSESLTLFVDAQYASPYAMSAYVALSVKPLAFDIRTVDLSAADHHAPAFAALSLHPPRADAGAWRLRAVGVVGDRRAQPARAER